MRAAIYARVSDRKQRDKHTIASQLSTLPAYAKAQGWTVAQKHVFVDDGRTAKAGHLEKRDGFSRLLAAMGRGEIDVVVVIDQDRLSRSEDLAERGAILGAFQRAGVKVAIASTGQLLDLSSSMGDLLASLQGFFSAEENRKRRERTVRGRQAAARAGRPSSPPPQGLVYDRAKAEWRHSDDAKLVREVFERIADGDSCGEIAVDWHRRGVKRARSKKWDRERIWRIATNSAYKGEWLADKHRRITIAVPPIVDEDLWQRVQDRLSSGRMRGLRRTRHVYLLEKISFCALCHSPIFIHDPRHDVVNYKRVPTPYYICSQRRRREGLGGERCTLPLQRVEVVDQRVWAVVSKLLQEPGALELALSRRVYQANEDTRAWAGDLAQWQQRLTRLQRVEETILERFRRGAISDAALDTELGKIGRERRALQQQIETARAQAAGAATAREMAALAKEHMGKWRAKLEAATPEQRREIVRTLVPGTAQHRAILGATGIELQAVLAFEGTDGVTVRIVA